MSLILSDADRGAFYSEKEAQALYQGDIISAELIGFKEEGQPNSPDFWLIITKSCDLTFRNNSNIVSKNHFTLIPISTWKQYFNALSRKINDPSVKKFFGKFVLLGLMKFSKSITNLKDDAVESILQNKITKFSYLPPDGTVFTEPMLIDYDLIQILSGDETQNVLNGKVLQLASPFREFIAQRFASHYSSIGINDNAIKASSHKAAVKEYFKKI